MPKKLSGVMLPRRLDAIDFLGTYLKSKPIPTGMRSPPFSIEQAGNVVVCSRELMEELAKESITFKNFWQAASNLARLMEAKDQKQYVDKRLEEKLKDEYIQARDACVNLDIGYSEYKGRLDS